MSDQLTASVVGCGSGGSLSLDALAASECFKLVAATDLRPDVAAAVAAKYGIQTFTNHAEMFLQCPTDIVCVSTYAPTHEAVATDALQLPLKGILVEKPLADTVAAGRRIVAACKARNLNLAVPHGLLVGETPLEILSRVRSGEIGALKLVDIQVAGWDIINAGIHWLNYFVHLTDFEPIDYVLAACDASTRTYRDSIQVETWGATYVQTKSGVRCVMNTGDEVQTNRAGKGTVYRIVGTGGQIEFWGWENGYYIQNAQFPAGTVLTPVELPGSRHQRHLENMAAMIGLGVTDYSVAESSLFALEICEAAYLSNRHRCRVAFPLDQFTPPTASDWDPGRAYAGVGGGRDGRKL
jgi:predicted dehydrogenase